MAAAPNIGDFLIRRWQRVFARFVSLLVGLMDVTRDCKETNT